jgi:hypothetical protein
LLAAVQVEHQDPEQATAVEVEPAVLFIQHHNHSALQTIM